jgi:hypothetical protein
LKDANYQAYLRRAQINWIALCLLKIWTCK